MSRFKCLCSSQLIKMCGFIKKVFKRLPFENQQMALKLVFLNEKSNTMFTSILLPIGPFTVLKISTSHHITLRLCLG